MKTLIADRRWSKKYPELGTGPVSAASSVSAEFFELERDRIFRRSWLNIGTIWEIPEPGDYFVCERDLQRFHPGDARTGQEGTRLLQCLLPSWQQIGHRRKRHLSWPSDLQLPQLGVRQHRATQVGAGCL